MAKTIKTQRWWGNVALKVDAEILALDVMEDGLQFRSRREKKRAHEIRAAIAGIECCHFKARHRIERIIHAIKYMVCLVNGSPESVHLNDDWRSRWRSILDYLDSWAGEGRVDLPGTGRVEINGISAKRLDCLLGEKNDAKTRQVRLLAGYLRRRVALWFDTTGSFKKRRDSEHKLDKELQREIEARFDSINIPVGDGTKNLANLLLENFCISNRCFM
nr:hypothetical protein [Candidatus Sigynarchaeota archaeon]